MIARRLTAALAVALATSAAAQQRPAQPPADLRLPQPEPGQIGLAALAQPAAGGCRFSIGAVNATQNMLARLVLVVDLGPDNSHAGLANIELQWVPPGRTRWRDHTIPLACANGPMEAHVLHVQRCEVLGASDDLACRGALTAVRSGRTDARAAVVLHPLR